MSKFGNATVQEELIPVRHTIREDDGSHWLQIDIPNGWDDVKRLTKKVLTYQGRNYTYMSWNSDRLTASFKENNEVAVISRRKEKRVRL